MVAKNDIVAAIQRIDQALRHFVGGNGDVRVRVLETQWGLIHALVGSDKFKGVGLGERQELVWKFLREHVETEALAALYGITTLEPQDYDRIMRNAEWRPLEDLGLL